MLRNSLKLIRQEQTNLPRIFYTTYNEKALEKIKKEIQESKKNYKWRTPPAENPAMWKSKLEAFGNDEQTSDVIAWMQQPVDLSPSGLKNWWNRRKERVERYMQQYVSERHAILGNDLATAHFILYRGGSVRFLKSPKWMQADEDGQFDLPNKFDMSYKLEAVKCDNMVLYYEGLENIRGLLSLKFLSFKDVKTFDDWSLDRVSGGENPNLEVLDLSGTNITERGLSALYRISSLKLLILDDPKASPAFELTCAMLEECLPKLRICAAKEIHNL